MNEQFAQFVPLILIGVVFYFLLIRPQQKRVKDHKAMIEAVRRGDSVVTAGGIAGKVIKVRDDNMVQVEIAPDVRVDVVKSTLSDVRSKSEPADGVADNKEKESGGFLGKFKK
ncbi:preprotein translocase subunit YajC [Sneathiella sp. P13V-1]|uniref:preprotein translocase subunit YajC n=1 Tax=Sneathiella sp. P13V-1 TaxID=2697366 RepID=UPI00187B5E7F|nr:preprotein translocase subunit YajC [Sneathiella sp. P13V-1]MBE7637673.1 preprotein translocase subunit YajC [Sneathiella sp. P13V-1]